VRVHRVVIGLLAGLILGSVISATHSATALRIVNLIAPLGQLWVNAIRMTVVPLVVSLLFVAVAGREPNEGLGRLGIVTIATFLALLSFAAVVALLLGPPLIADMKLTTETAAALRFTGSAEAGQKVAQARQLLGFGSWITSLVPANVVKAASDGAMLPVIVFTFLFALATRRIDLGLRQALIGFFGALANATTTIVDWIIAIAPLGICALVLAAASRTGVALAGAMGYYVVAISALLVLFAFLMYPVATAVGRIPLGWFTRGVLPAQVVALSSSSSLASLPPLVEGGRALGMPTPIIGFVLPLSASVFKVATPITWIVGTLFLAKLYGIAMGTTALLTLAVTAVVLSLTIPGVPQGAQLLLAPLLVTYGIPADGVALLIAVDTIPDLFGTMTNVTGDFVVAAVAARRGVAEEVDEAASSPDA
jgi:proton glutamate symport protein